MRTLLPLMILAAIGSTEISFAGTYSNISECSESDGCELGFPVNFHPTCNNCVNDPDQDCCHVTPFGITHPFGYDNVNDAVLPIRICVKPDDLELEPSVLRSIAMWEALVPTTDNCGDCYLWEEGLPVGDKQFADLTVLHELGHCAMALDHIDRLWDADGDDVFEPTSFTRSANAATIPQALEVGQDGVRGSRDDLHRSILGQLADSVSWFRTLDNDPFLVSPGDIDEDNYSSLLNDLPGGGIDRWGASANRKVGELEGYIRTQSVMYSGTAPGQAYYGLSADDVNMVKMGMTGKDTQANTPDDYTIDLQYIGACPAATAQYDISVELGMLSNPTNPGVCLLTDIDYSFFVPLAPQAKHFSSVKFLNAPFEIVLNELLNWTFDSPVPLLFDGFESGNTSTWSSTVP